MNPNRLFAPALLCVAAVLLVVASCKKDENWNPTWAIPVLKEASFTVGKFVNSDMVKEFNADIRSIWDRYVTEQMDVNPTTGADSVDKVAYTVLTDSAQNYVQYNETTGMPELRQEAIDSLGLNDDQIQEINNFLGEYYRNKLGGGSAGGASKKGIAVPGVRPKADPPAGDNVIDHVLGGSSSEPTSIFTTVANLLDFMPGFAEQIDAELDTILAQATMNESFAANLKEFAGSADGIKLIHVSVDANNSMPFQVQLYVAFIDSSENQPSREIHKLLDGIGKNSELPPQSNNELQPLVIPMIVNDSKHNEEKLKDIVENTTHIRLKVHLSKSQPLSSNMLRTLSDRGIRFNLRVRMRANMSELL